MSLEYWNDRWKNAASPGEGSWAGDKCARYLEQRWIRKHLKEVDGPIVDIGCGAGAIFEGNLGSSIKTIALNRGYLGIDGSATAIEQARAAHPSLAFRVQDLTTAPLLPGPDSTVLSRRFIQNVPRDKRGDLLYRVKKFKHAVLLECTVVGLGQTNVIRSLMRHWPPLKEPEFNEFLTAGELESLGGTVTWPLGLYYAITRGLLDNKNCEMALDVCLAYEKELTVPMGLVAGITW